MVIIPEKEPLKNASGSFLTIVFADGKNTKNRKPDIWIYRFLPFYDSPPKFIAKGL